MNAANVPFNTYDSPWKQPDPGTGKPLRIRTHGCHYAIDIAAGATEVGTVPNPDRPGIIATIVARTVGAAGTRAYTFAAAVNAAGDTVGTFSAVGDRIKVESYEIGAGTYRWRVLEVVGVTGIRAELQALNVGGVIVDPNKLVTANCILNGNCIDHAFFTADRAYQVVGITEIHATAGNDGSAVNLQVTKDTGTNAPGAGTDLLTNNTNAGFNLKATANTLQTGTLTATTASLQLAAGDRLSLDFAGTVTTLAGVQVTVALKPI